jgi:hypothetical protein
MYLLVSYLLLAVPVLAETQPEHGSQPMFDASKDQVIAMLQVTANQVNTSLPMMIDRDTRFERMGVGPGRRVTFMRTLIHYTVTEMPGQRLEELVGESIRNGVCSAPEMQVWLIDEVTIVYRYSDKNGTFIHRFMIDRQTCAQL